MIDEGFAGISIGLARLRPIRVANSESVLKGRAGGVSPLSGWAAALERQGADAPRSPGPAPSGTDSQSRVEGLRGRRARKYVSWGDCTSLTVWVQTTCRPSTSETLARASGAAA